MQAYSIALLIMSLTPSFLPPIGTQFIHLHGEHPVERFSLTPPTEATPSVTPSPRGPSTLAPLGHVLSVNNTIASAPRDAASVAIPVTIYSTIATPALPSHRNNAGASAAGEWSFGVATHGSPDATSLAPFAPGPTVQLAKQSSAYAPMPPNLLFSHAGAPFASSGLSSLPVHASSISIPPGLTVIPTSMQLSSGSREAMSSGSDGAAQSMQTDATGEEEEEFEDKIVLFRKEEPVLPPPVGNYDCLACISKIIPLFTSFPSLSLRFSFLSISLLLQLHFLIPGFNVLFFLSPPPLSNA